MTREEFERFIFEAERLEATCPVIIGVQPDGRYVPSFSHYTYFEYWMKNTEIITATMVL